MTAQNDTNVTNRPAPAKEAAGPTTVQILLITAAVVGALTLAAYQFLFCASCWA